MAQETLVEKQIDDGQRLLEHLIQTGFPVSVAFWLRPSEGGLWHLYIASPAVDEEGLQRAYRDAHTAIRQMPQPFWVDLFDIKLISPNDPIAKDIVAALRRQPRSHPVRYGGGRLGGVTIEEAYIYPLPAPVHGA